MIPTLFAPEVLRRSRAARRGWAALFAALLSAAPASALTLQSNPSSGEDSITEIVIDTTTGHALLIGYEALAANAVWRIERVHGTTGALDTGFDSDGIVQDDLSGGVDIPRAAVIDSGSLFVVGEASGTSDVQWHIQKRNVLTGALDTGFNTTGRLTVNPSAAANNPDYLSDVAVDSTSVYLAGSEDTSNTDAWRLEKRDKATGALVGTFAAGGALVVDAANADERLVSVAVDNSYLYLAGYTNAGSGDMQLHYRKHDKNSGALISSTTVNPTGLSDVVKALAEDASYLYIAATQNNNNLWRIEKRDKSDLSLVTSFDGDGVVTSTISQPSDIAVDGSYIYIAGWVNVGGSNTKMYIEKRDKATGALVAAFDSDGTAELNPSSDNDLFQAVALSSNSALLYAGGFDSTLGMTNDQWHLQIKNAQTWYDTRVWDGGGADNLASTAANWAGDTAPVGGDAVLFDATAKACHWDLSGVALASATLNVGYSSAVVLVGNMTIAGDFAVHAGTFTTGASTLTLAGDFLLTGGYMDMTGGTLALNGGAQQTFVASGGDGQSPDTFTLNSSSEVVLSVSVLGRLSTSLNSGTLRLDGAGANGPFEIEGDLSIGFSASFDAGTSTVAFTNASRVSTFSRTLPVATAFNAIQVNEPGKRVNFASPFTANRFEALSSTMVFTPGVTSFTVNQYLSLANGGAYSPRVMLRSSSPGSQWNFTLTGGATQTVSGVDVQDSNAAGGQTIRAASSVNTGNNRNWDMAPQISITGDLGSVMNVAGSLNITGVPVPHNEIGHHVLRDAVTAGGPYYYVLYHSTTSPNLDNPDHSGVIRYDSNGSMLSSTTLAGNMSGDAFAQDSAGNIYVGEKDSGPAGVWISKFSKELVFLSSVAVPTADVGNITRMVSDGSFLYTVNDGGSVDNGGKVYKYNSSLVAVATAPAYAIGGSFVNGDSIALDPSGNVYVAFSSNPSTAQMRLVKYSSNSLTYITESASPPLENADMAASASAVYLSGADNANIYLRRFDLNLNYTGVSSTLTVSTNTFLAPVRVGPSGSVYVAGAAMNANSDYLLAKFNPISLVLQSSVTLNMGSTDKAVGLAVENSTVAYLTGTSFTGTHYDARTVRMILPPTDETPPAAVNDLTARSAGNFNMEMRWTAPGDDGSVGTLGGGSFFLIQYSTDSPLSATWSPSNAQIIIATSGVNPGASVSTKTFLAGTTQYYFHIWTRDEAGNYSEMDTTPSTATAYNSEFDVDKVPGLAANVGRHHSMTLDRSNNLHVAYRDETNNALMYVKRTGSVWGAPVTIAAGADAWSPSLAVDGNGAPHVVFADGTADQVRYSSAPGGTFSAPANIFAMGLTNPASYYTSLALSGAGLPRVAIGDYATGGLKFAEWNGTSWSAAVNVDTGSVANTAVYISMAMSGDSREHIAYSRNTGTNYALKYATRTASGGWVLSTIEPFSQVTANVSLALDASDRGHVVFYKAVDSGFHYRRFDGINWTNLGIVTISSPAAKSVLAMTLDGNGRPLVAYYKNNDDVGFAEFNGSSFNTRTVDVTGAVGTESMDIVLSSGGAAALAYWDATNNDLKQASGPNLFIAPMGGNERGRVHAPSGLAATFIDRTTVTWGWSNSTGTNQTFTRVFGSTALAGPYAQRVDLAGAASVWNETGLKAGTTYYRYVGAVNSGGVVTSSVAVAVTSPGLIPGNVRPAAKGGSDGTADDLADIWVQDVDGASVDAVAAADGWYTVLSGGTTMYFTSFDTSTFAGLGDVLFSSVTLRWKYSSGGSYAGGNSIQISTDNGASWGPAGAPVAGGQTDRTESVDLYNLGVTKVSQLAGLDLRFVNNDAAGPSRSVNFDYLLVEASTPITRLWAGPNGGPASNANNWFPTGVPARNDSVRFDDNNLADCAWDIFNAVLSTFTIDSTFGSQTVLVQGGAGNTITLNDSFAQSGGTMTHQTTSFNLRVGRDFTVTGGYFSTDYSGGAAGVVEFSSGAHVVNAPNAWLGNVLFSSGSATAAGGLNVRGNFTTSSGTFGSNGQTVTVGGTLQTFGSGLTSTQGLWVFNGIAAQSIDFQGWDSLSLSGSGSKNFFGGITAGGAVAVSSSVSLNLNSQGLTVMGNFTSSGTYVMPATVTFSGAASAVVFSSNAIPGDVVLNKTGGATLTANGALDVDGHFKLQGGTFVAGGYVHKVAGDLTQTGGYLNGQASTFRFDGPAGSSVTLTSGYFNHLAVQKSLGVPATFYFASAVDINGNLSITNSCCSTLSVNSGGFTHTVGGNLTLGEFDLDFNPAAGTFAFDGASPQSVDRAGLGYVNFFNFEAGGVNTVTWDSPVHVKGDVQILTGAAVAPGTYTHILDGNFTLAGTAAFVASTGTVIFDDPANTGLPRNVSLGAPSNRFYNVNIDSATLQAASNLDINGKLDMDGASMCSYNSQLIANGFEIRLGGDVDVVTGSSLQGGGTYYFDGATAQTLAYFCGDDATIAANLVMAGSTATIAAGDNLLVSGNFTLQQGSFTVLGASMTVGGHWMETGGSFNMSAGMVAFAGGSLQNITQLPTNAFPNLVVNKSSQDLVPLSTVTINGYFDEIVGGGFDANGQTIRLRGDFIGPANVFGNGHWIFDGAATQNINHSIFDQVTVAAGGSKRFQHVSGLSTVSHLTLEPGSIMDLNPALTLNIGGSLTSSGTFQNTSTVAFQGAANATVFMAAGSTFTHVRVNKAAGSTLTPLSNLDVNGNFALDGGTFTVASPLLFNVSGNVSAGGGTMLDTQGTWVFDGFGVSSYTYASGNVTFNDINVGSNKTLKTPNGIQLRNLFVSALATFDPSPAVAALTGALTLHGALGSGTIQFNGSGTQQNINGSVGLAAFDALTIGQAGRNTNVVAMLPIQVSNTFTLASGTFTVSSPTLTLLGNLSSPGGALAMPVGSTLAFQGAGAHTVSFASNTLHHVEVSKPAGFLTVVGGALNVNGNFTLSNGEFMFAAVATHTFAGHFTQVAGTTITANSDTVEFDGATAADLSLVSPLGHVRHNKSGALTLLSTVTVSGNYTSIGSGVIGIGANRLYIGGNFSNGVAGFNTAAGDTRLVFNGAASQSIQSASALPATLIESSSDVVAGGALSFGVTAGAPSFRLDSGTFRAGNFSHVINRDWSQTGGTFVADTSTISFQGGGTSQNIFGAGPFWHLRAFNVGSSVTAQNALDVNGDFTISGGTFVAGAFEHTLAGNFSGAGGGFVAVGSTITFDSPALQLVNAPGRTFNHIRHTGVGTLRLDSALDIDGKLGLDAGTWNMNGQTVNAAGHVTPLGGSVIGTGAWVFDGNGAQDVQDVFAGGNIDAVISNTGAPGVRPSGSGWTVRNFSSGGGAQFDATNDLIEVHGDWTAFGGTFTKAGSTVSFVGASSAAIVSAITGFENMLVNKPSGLALAADAALAGNLGVTGGAFALGASTLSVAGLTTVSGAGTLLNLASGTAVLQGQVSVLADGTLLLPAATPAPVLKVNTLALNSGGRFESYSSTNVITAAPPAAYGLLQVVSGTPTVQGLTFDSVRLEVLGYSNFVLNNANFIDQEPGQAAFTFGGTPNAETVNNAYFDASVSTNVHRPGTGGVTTMAGAGGPKAGPSFERDPNAKVEWDNFDDLAPVSSVGSPLNGQFLNGAGLQTVTGTSSDPAEAGSSGVQNVSVAARQLFDGQWWGGGSFNSGSPVFISAVGIAPWSWAVSTNSLISGTSYFFVSRAGDALNLESPLAPGVTVYYDNDLPVVFVTSPADGAILSSLSAISGTSADAFAGVQGVELSVRDFGPDNASGGGDDVYWNTVTQAFDLAAETFFAAQGTAVWTSTQAAAAISTGTAGRFYEVKARATDNAGNNSASIAGVNANTFRADSVPPTSGVGQPSHGQRLSSLAFITGTMSDAGAGVSNVQVRIQNMGSLNFWDGGGFNSASEVWNNTTLFPSSWSYAAPGLLTNTAYQIVSRATDAAGNFQNAFTLGVSSISFVFDTTPPAAPTGLAAANAGTDGDINITWNASGESDLGGYRLYRATYSFSASADPGVTLALAAGATTTAFQDTLLANGTNYFYRLSALDVTSPTALESSLSAVSSATPTQGADHLHFTGIASTNVVAGAPFSATVEVHDASHTLTTIALPTVGFATTTGAGFAPPQNTSVPVAYTFLNGDGGAKTFTNGFTFRSAGARLLVAEAAGLPTPSTGVAFNVSPAAADHFAGVTPSAAQFVMAGTLASPGKVAVTARLEDAFNNGLPAGTTVNLTVTNVTGVSGSIIASTTTNASGEVGVSFPLDYFISTAAGHSAQVTFTAAPASSATAVITTIADNPSKLVFLSSPPSVTVDNESGLFTLQRRDDFGNPSTFTATTANLTAAPVSPAGQFRLLGSTIASVSILPGGATAQFNYFDQVAGTFTITADDGGPLLDASTDYVLTAGSAVKLLAVMPGQTYAPGTANGFTGSPSNRTAGAAFAVTVRAVDAFWNVDPSTSPGAVLLETPNDPHDAELTQALPSGVAVFNPVMRTAGSHVIQPGDGVGGLIETQTPSFNLVPNVPSRLLVLAPGEAHVPGAAAGKVGAPITQIKNSTFTLTINITDLAYNTVAAGGVANLSIVTQDPTDVDRSTPIVASSTQVFASICLTSETVTGWTVTVATTVGVGLAPSISSPIVVIDAAIAPTGLAGVALSSTSIQWTWTDASGNEQGFSLLDGSDVWIASMPANTTFYAETAGLTPNLLAIRKVRAYTVTTSSTSAPAQRYTHGAAPINPVISAVGATGFTYGWTGTGSAATYIAQASTASDFSGTVLSSNTLGPATFSGLVPNTTYYARVQAVNDEAIGGLFVAPASTVTLAAVPAALALSSVGATSLQADWSANGNPAGTQFQAQISTDNAFGVAVTTTAGTTLTSATFTGLAPNTTYFVQVRAVGYDGTPSAYTATASTVTDANAPLAVAFSGVTATALQANWGTNGNPLGTQYVAEASSDAFTTSTAVSTTSLFAVFSPLQSNTTWEVRVRALNSAGTPSVDTNLGSTSTLAAQPVSAGFSGVSDVQVTANWTTNGNRSGTQFQAQLSSDPAFLVGVTTVSTSLSAATFPGLTANTTYYGRVRAVGNAGGFSAFEPIGSTTTLPLAPGAVTFSNMAVDALQADWTANGNPAPPNTTYLAEISTAAGFSPLWTSSTTAALNALFGTGGQGAALSANTTYFVRVRVVGGGGVLSGPSSASTSTLANAPLAVAYSSVTETSFRANWGPNGNPTPPGTVYTGEISTSPVFATSTPFGPLTTLLINPSGLTVETSYYVRVRAVNHNGVASANTDLGVVFTADLTPPLQGILEPNGLEESGLSLATLSGTAVDPTTGVTAVAVRITDGTNDWNGAAFSAVGVPNFQPAATFAASIWTYSGAFGWTHGVSYSVVARATDLRGNVSYTTRTFTADSEAPNVINTLSALATGFPGQVKLTWTVPTEDAAGVLPPTDYEIRYASVPFIDDVNYVNRASATAINGGFTVGSLKNDVLINGLTDGVNWFFHVKSIDNVGNKSAVDTSGTGASAVPGDLTGPNAITNLNASVTGLPGEVQLTWTVPQEFGAFSVPVQFDVRYSTDSVPDVATFLSLGNSQVIAVATATTSPGDPRSTTITGLTPGALLRFYIVSQDVVGNNSALSNDDIAIVDLDTTPPGTIGNLSAVPGVNEGEVSLTWTVPPDNDGQPGSGEPVSYDIRYATSSFSTAEFTALPSRIVFNGGAAEGTAFTTTLTGLTPGTSYFFRIRSKDESNQISAVDTTTPQASAEAKGTPLTSITGSVTQSGGQPINLVTVEALTADGTVAASGVSNSSGAWRLDGLTAGAAYTVRARWELNEIESSAFIDNVLPGSNGIAFTLSIDVQLASISGTVALASGGAKGAYGAPGGAGAGYVEIYVGGHKVAQVPTDDEGRFTVPNLLPGRYVLRAYNGLSFSEMMEVTLAEGQSLALAFKFDLLPPDKVYLYPNPASERVTLRFESMASPIEAQALIFDIAGNLVKELPGEASVRSGSEISWNWDLTNDGGQAVASGVYLVHVKVYDPSTNRREGVVKKLAVIK